MIFRPNILIAAKQGWITRASYVSWIVIIFTLTSIVITWTILVLWETVTITTELSIITRAYFVFWIAVSIINTTVFRAIARTPRIF